MLTNTILGLSLLAEFSIGEVFGYVHADFSFHVEVGILQHFHGSGSEHHQLFGEDLFHTVGAFVFRRCSTFTNPTAVNYTGAAWEFHALGADCTDTANGAVVSVSVGADKKTVGQIKADIDAAAVGDANFVIADFGAFDVESYAPTTGVLGCATLNVGVVAKRFVPDERDMPKLVSEIGMTLVFDERAADGIAAAAFLQKIKQYIENPELMLL